MSLKYFGLQTEFKGKHSIFNRSALDKQIDFLWEIERTLNCFLLSIFQSNFRKHVIEIFYAQSQNSTKPTKFQIKPSVWSTRNPDGHGLNCISSAKTLKSFREIRAIIHII